MMFADIHTLKLSAVSVFQSTTREKVVTNLFDQCIHIQELDKIGVIKERTDVKYRIRHNNLDRE